jgi:hypothetical protein
MSRTTIPDTLWRVTSAKREPAAGVDAQVSETAGTEDVVPGAGLGNDPVVDALGLEAAEPDTVGEWVG